MEKKNILGGALARVAARKAKKNAESPQKDSDRQDPGQAVVAVSKKPQRGDVTRVGENQETGLVLAGSKLPALVRAVQQKALEKRGGDIVYEPEVVEDDDEPGAVDRVRGQTRGGALARWAASQAGMQKGTEGTGQPGVTVQDNRTVVIDNRQIDQRKQEVTINVQAPPAEQARPPARPERVSGEPLVIKNEKFRDALQMMADAYELTLLTNRILDNFTFEISLTVYVNKTQPKTFFRKLCAQYPGIEFGGITQDEALVIRAEEWRSNYFFCQRGYYS